MSNTLRVDRQNKMKPYPSYKLYLSCLFDLFHTQQKMLPTSKITI